MPRAYIFDMDGTMVDNMDYHVESWDLLFKEVGHAIDTDEFIRTTAGRTTSTLLRMVLGKNAADAEIERLAARKESIYRDIYRPHLKPVRGLVEFLHDSRALGIQLAVGSSARQANIDFVLDGLELRRFFDAIVGAADVTHAKPDPEMFLLAAQRMGVDPKDCRVFEDAKAGLDAAHAAGMSAVLVATDDGVLELAAHPAVRQVIRDFTEIAP